MAPLLDFVALLGTCLPVQAVPASPTASTDGAATEAVRALAERTQKLAAFTAVYRIKGFNGEEREACLYYRAPDRARHDVVEKGSTARHWMHGGVISTRGVDRRGRYALENDLVARRMAERNFESMLDKEFGRPPAAAVPPKVGVSFRYDFEVPLADGEDCAIVTTVLFDDPRYHLLAWLDGGTAASPWRAEGDEFVRRTAKGGVVRVSKSSGFLVSLAHPAGFELSLVRFSEEASEADLAVPPRAANEEDRTPAMESEAAASLFRKQRSAVYEADLDAPGEPGDTVRRHLRLGRVFGAVDAPMCRRMDVDDGVRRAKELEQFAAWVRDQWIGAADSAEKRASVDASIGKWAAAYEQSIEEWGARTASNLESPYDEEALRKADAALAARVDAIVKIERAVFLAQYHELVHVPAMRRLEEALHAAETRR